MAPEIERRLAAILSADVVGYSRLMAEDEVATVRTLTSYRKAITDLVEEHRGRVVDSPGDNLLADFPSATEAVRCAVQIQGVVAVRNAQLPDDRKMQFRIGVHLGEVMVEGQRIYGDGVNIAARLEGLAETGGIWVSGEVHNSVHNKLDLRFTDLGEQEVKNIPNPVRVYSVSPKTGAASSAVGPRRTMPLAAALIVIVLAALAVSWWWLAARGPGPPAVAPGQIRSLAVLPLENLSGDPEQEYFADGMTEALIGELAKLGALRVISRTSVMQYKRTPKHLPEIAKELDVDAVIEGTVFRQGDRVRITVQLLNARSDSHLWTERYDRELSRVFDLHTDVARAVAAQVQLKLTSEERALLAAGRSIDPRALDAYLRGVHLMRFRRFDPGARREVFEHFERAIEIDPDYAAAHARLAEAYLAQRDQLIRVPGLEVMTRARQAALRALELDDRLGAAHAALGLVYLHQDWDWQSAGRELKRAVRLAPSDPISLEGNAFYLSFSGQHAAAIAMLERALAAAPLDLSVRESYARILLAAGKHEGALGEEVLAAGKYERALGEVREVLARDPGYNRAYLTAMHTNLELGRTWEAHRAWLELDRISGYDALVAARERGYRSGGFEGGTRAWVEALIAGQQGPVFSPVVAASAWAMVGELDRCFEWLERAYAQRDPDLLSMFFDLPAAARKDPRFAEFLPRIGFPEAS